MQHAFRAHLAIYSLYNVYIGRRVHLGPNLTIYLLYNVIWVVRMQAECATPDLANLAIYTLYNVI